MRITSAGGGVWLISLLLSVCHIRSRSINTFAGPFILVIHRVTPCPSDGTASMLVRASHFNPARPFDMQTLTGNLTMKRPLADNFWVAAILNVWANNQWKQNAFVLKFPHASCALGRDMAPSLFQFLGRISDTPMDKKSPCVIPPGSYTFERERINLSSHAFPRFKVMPYGRYRMHLRMGGKGNPVTRFCSIWEVEYVPQP